LLTDTAAERNARHMKGIVSPNSIIIPAGEAAPVDAFADAMDALSFDAWWRFDETSGTNANDEIGTADLTHDGATVNQASLLTDGLGKSVLYDGTNDRSTLVIPAITALSFTISFLIKTPAAGSLNSNGATVWVGSDTTGYGITVQNSGVSAYGLIYIEPNLGEVTTPVVLALNTTYHFAITYDNVTKIAKTYLNGAVQETLDMADFAGDPGYEPVAPASTTYVGFNPQDSAYVAATIDEPAVKGSALSDANILSIAEAAGLA
jgi:hypothetical protein